MDKINERARFDYSFNSQGTGAILADKISETVPLGVDLVKQTEDKIVKNKSKILSKKLNKRVVKKSVKRKNVYNMFGGECRALRSNLIKAIANNPRYNIKYVTMRLHSTGKMYIRLESKLVKALQNLLNLYKKWLKVTSKFFIKIRKDCTWDIKKEIVDKLTSAAKKLGLEVACFDVGRRDSSYGFVYHYTAKEAPDELKDMFSEDEMREQFPGYILDLVDECVAKVFPNKIFALSDMTRWSADGIISLTVSRNSKASESQIF